MFAIERALAILSVSACIGMWILWDIDVNRLTKAKNDAIAAQVLKCEADKKITEDISRELQNNLGNLRDQLARAKRVQPTRCVAVTTDTSRRNDATSHNKKLPDTHGITSDALLDFAYDAEVVGQKLDACQMYVDKIRK